MEAFDRSRFLRFEPGLANNGKVLCSLRASTPISARDLDISMRSQKNSNLTAADACKAHSYYYILRNLAHIAYFYLPPWERRDCCASKNLAIPHFLCLRDAFLLSQQVYLPNCTPVRDMREVRNWYHMGGHHISRVMVNDDDPHQRPKLAKTTTKFEAKCQSG